MLSTLWQLIKTVGRLRRLFGGKSFHHSETGPTVSYGNAATINGRPVSDEVYNTVITEGPDGHITVLDEQGPPSIDKQKSAEEIEQEFHPRGLSEASTMQGTPEGFHTGLEKIAQAHYVTMDQHEEFQSAEDKRKVSRLKNNYQKLDELRKAETETNDKVDKSTIEKINLEAKRDSMRKKARLDATPSTFEERVVQVLLAATMMALMVYYVCAYFLYAYADNYLQMAQQAAENQEDPKLIFKGILSILPEAFCTWGGHWPFAIFTTLFLIAGQSFIIQRLNNSSDESSAPLSKWVRLLPNFLMLAGMLIVDLLIAYHIQSKQLQVELYMGLVDDPNPSPWNEELFLMLFLGFMTGLCGSYFFGAYRAIQHKPNLIAKTEVEVVDIDRQLTLLEMLIQKANELLEELKEKIRIVVEKIVALIAELNTRVVTYWTLLLKWRAYQAGYSEYIAKYAKLSPDEVSTRLRQIGEVMNQLQTKYIPTQSRPNIV